MAVRAHLAAELGQELMNLGSDQGRRLEQILWRLKGQTQRMPHDLETAVAYNHALALAGKAQPAREEALRMLDLVTEASPIGMWLNTFGALVDAGLVAQATRFAAHPRQIKGPQDELNFLNHLLGLVVRFGEMEWSTYLQDSPIIAFMAAQGLSPWWPGQQRAIEAAIGERTASTVIALERDPESGSRRLCLDYHTDASSHVELSMLHDRVLDAMASAYRTHPDGEGAFLGSVVVEVHGAEIPLAELDP